MALATEPEVRNSFDPPSMRIGLSAVLLQKLATSGFVPPHYRARVMKLRGCDIDPSALIGPGIRFPFPWSLTMGHGTVLNTGAYIDGYGRVIIEQEAYLGIGVRFLTTSHHLSGPDRRAGDMFHTTIRVGAGAWVGAGTIILPGREIGAGAVVGAGSVVTKDVPEHCIYAGNPARLVRELDR